MEDANRALQLDPRSGLAYERRAAILADLGRITEARADALAAQKVGQTLPNELIRKLQ
jgi:Flp pilus assembly protein TadD